MENLNKLLGCLASVKNEFTDNYHVPSLWINPNEPVPSDITIDPVNFYSSRIEELLSTRIPRQDLKRQFAYNMFIRYSAAYDHNADNKIETGLLGGIWRETGTFLKAIALLPYIKSIGCNLIYLLPVTSIGIDCKKGNLGSPYAIANPYALDQNLADNIPGISAEEQFAAFIEAAHLLGFRVITEFVFRTASIDSPLAIEHPEWFYWIKDDIRLRDSYKNEHGTYGPPYFNDATLQKIRKKVDAGDFNELPAPDKYFQALFTDIPAEVKLVDGKITGITKDGVHCRIPSAFADWPPDDKQPVWSDVTYLRLYDDKNFNYIAYSTVRMYDNKLSSPEKKIESVWEHISGIIPYYQEKYGIDGVMIDMGHALPDELLHEIIARARKRDPQFIIWEENFTLTKESREKGFNASLGYMPFDEHIPEKLRQIISLLASGNYPIQFFLTPETHNTKRAAARNGAENYSRFAWAINCFLPGILFIHSGFELGEKHPVNTGLGFDSAESAQYPPDRLPLFSAASLDWNKEPALLQFIRKIYRIAFLYDLVSITPVKSINPHVIAFIAESLVNETIIIASIPDDKPYNTLLNFVNEYTEINDYLSGRKIDIDNSELMLSLAPNQIIIGEISQ